MTDDVWYASYGSNLCEERFQCYIKGGNPPGSRKTEVGCSDQTLPKATSTVELNYQLYFSEYADSWGGGVAFIGLERTKNIKTLGRMYLITKEQFIDVVKQENSRDDLTVDFASVIKHESSIIKKSWYGNILYVGEHQGFPIFTFTHYQDQQEKEMNMPSKSYLNMLIRGYKEAYTLSNDHIADYLLDMPGVTGNYSKKQLLELMK